MSTSGGAAVIDSMDTTTDPSPGSQGAEPPPSPGPRDEAGAADEGSRPRTRQVFNTVLQDDTGPGLEEPASSLQLAQLRLQEQLDARACARLCWLQMEGPYRLCRLGPYITPPSPKKEERGCTFMFVAIELFCQHGLAQVVSKDLKQGLAVVRCCC